MKRISTTIIFSFFTVLLFAQNNNFLIYSELNPDSKVLSGFVNLQYVNTTNQPLSEIYFNLWANAYNDKNKQFVNQLIEEGHTEIYFAKNKDLGGYQNLVFLSGNDTLSMNYLDEGKENCKIYLKNPLKQGDSIKLKIEYKLKLPKLYYDFGYNRNQYNIIYWYPTPAVYGKNGWITQNRSMCNNLFADQYNYTVILKIPENFTVSAPGKLLTENELSRIDSIANNKFVNKTKKTSSYDPLNFKTLRYQADNIQHFTWIASPLFSIKRDIIKSGDKSFPLNLFYTSNNFSDIDFINAETKEAVNNISAKLGTYPFNKINIVLSKENRTSSSFPENLIYHKEGYFFEENKFIDFICPSLAENYLSQDFYNLEKNPGILATMKYLISYEITDSLHLKEHRKYYTDIETIKDKTNNLSCNKKPILIDLIYNDSLCNSQNKYSGCYNLIALNYLKEFTGKDIFYKTLRNFNSEFDNKEFDYNDFRSYFEDNVNKPLDWFFEGIMKNAEPFTYSIKDIRKDNKYIEVVIENKDKIAIPFEIGAIKNDSIIELVRSEGFNGIKKFKLKRTDADIVELDPRHLIYKNKNLKSRIVLHKTKQFFNNFSFFKKDKPSNVIIPIIAYNANDGWMPGIFLSDYGKIKNHYFLNLHYGTKTKSIIGSGDFQRKISSNDHSFFVGINSRSYHRLRTEKTKLRYTRFSPYISFYLKDRPKFTQHFKFRFSLINDEEYGVDGKDSYWRYNSQLDYFIKGNNLITPYDLKFELEHQFYNYYNKNHYIKLSTTVNAAYMYKNKRYFSVRFYAAKFLYNSNLKSTSNNKGTLGLIGYGINDYLYDQYFIDRGAQSGFWSHQINMNTGGFKTAVSNSYGLGQSNNYVAAFNLVFDLPVKTGIKPFLDLGVYGYLPTISEGYSNKFLYSGGLMFQIIKNNFEIYLPLINSSEIENIYKESDNYFNRISFMINLNINSMFGFK